MTISLTMEAALNCWTLAEQAIADAIVASTNFQDIVEASDGPLATSALNAARLVFLDEVGNPLDGTAYTREELEQLRHFAVVTSTEDDGYTIERSPSGVSLASGVIGVHVTRLIRDSEYVRGSAQVPRRWFKNRVGSLVDDIYDYTFDNDGPTVRQIVVSTGPSENPDNDQINQGRFLTAVLSVVWSEAGSTST